MGDLLLEIGTEEIPAGYLSDGLEALRQLAEGFFKESQVALEGSLTTLGTPRRLVLIAEGVAEKQPDQVEEVTGPPRKVAYDENGRPTKAAVGFAQRQGVRVEDLDVIQTPKGDYLHCRRLIPGRPTRELLAEALPRMIAGLPWPKSMRWGSIDFAFVRPIHWILAVLNGEVVPFELAGIRTGNVTRGHRFMAPGTLAVSGPADFLAAMEKAFVVLDPRERRERVKRALDEAARAVGGRPDDDPELIGTVANLVEYPSAVCGSFDERFLELPEPVLITPMKTHQKYFPLYDAGGRLMRHFVAVNNTLARDTAVVRRGHERVLRARLSDAAFFFAEDRKRPLLARLEDLKGVIYQADLGTSFAKVERFSRLAESMAQRVLPQEIDAVRKVAALCKCDLVTQMVSEFPTLQGTMGREYARLEGYPEPVSQAIYEHYLPARAGDRLPESRIGALVGVADRLDTIAGCFAIGLEPTGTADPYALRRHALAIIRILEHMGWEFSLRALIDETLSILQGGISLDRESVSRRVTEFFRERYRRMMIREGYPLDAVEAVLASGLEALRDARSRIEALQRFLRATAESQALAAAFKRVVNILKKQEELCNVDPALFREPCESQLWQACESLQGKFPALFAARDYAAVLNCLAELRPPVDEFFDGVEIMTRESMELQKNRLGVLQNVRGLFLQLADFSKLSS